MDVGAMQGMERGTGTDAGAGPPAWEDRPRGHVGAPGPRAPAPPLLLLAALATALAGTPAGAQTVRFGIIADSVRAALDSAWSEDPRQVERAYCVRRARITARPAGPGAVDTIIRVLAIRPAPTRDAGPNHADFDCPPGTPSLHVHPPATCVGDDTRWCVAGGPGAFSCQPSREDYLTLVRLRDPYGIIQCDRRSFRFYYPSEFVKERP